MQAQQPHLPLFQFAICRSEESEEARNDHKSLLAFCNVCCIRLAVWIGSTLMSLDCLYAAMQLKRGLFSISPHELQLLRSCNQVLKRLYKMSDFTTPYSWSNWHASNNITKLFTCCSMFVSCNRWTLIVQIFPQSSLKQWAISVVNKHSGGIFIAWRYHSFRVTVTSQSTDVTYVRTDIGVIKYWP
jgi:hypothetical protein